jgi:hypothetical protein
VDVKLAEFKVASGCDGREETQASHADEWGERLCVVHSSALAAPLGDEPRFEAVSDLTLKIHMLLMTIRHGGGSTSSHVPLAMREEYSCCIAACH